MYVADRITSGGEPRDRQLLPMIDSNLRPFLERARGRRTRPANPNCVATVVLYPSRRQMILSFVLFERLPAVSRARAEH